MTGQLKFVKYCFMKGENSSVGNYPLSLKVILCFDNFMHSKQLTKVEKENVKPISLNQAYTT